MVTHSTTQQTWTFGQKAARWFTARSNYIDQRAVVTKYGWPVNPLMAAAGVGFTALHAYKAQPAERQKTIIRDTLVLGAAIGGSALAAHRWKPLADEGQLLVKNAQEALTKEEFQEAFPEAVHQLKAYFTDLKPSEKLKKEFPKVANAFQQDLDRLRLSGKTDEVRLPAEVLEDIYNKLLDIPEVGRKKVGEVFERLFDDGEGFWAEMGEAAKFFGIGGIGVLSGIAGGMVANQINNVHEKWTIPNMIKEGIFQFVANIGMCAVGAGAALAALNSDELIKKHLGEKSSLLPAAEAFTGFVNQSPIKKLLRTGIVLAGLSVGIIGGSHMANYVGSKWVNPLLDKLQGNPPSAKKLDDTRKLEACDVVLHADDIPTAAAIAGTAILGPWIIPFFPVSGYRAGIGYRNDEASKAQEAAKKRQECKQNPHAAYTPQPARVGGFGKSQPQPAKYTTASYATRPGGGYYYTPPATAWGSYAHNGKQPVQSFTWPANGSQFQNRYSQHLH